MVCPIIFDRRQTSSAEKRKRQKRNLRWDLSGSQTGWWRGRVALIFQRNHVLVALTEGCNPLQSAFGLGQQSHRTVAIYRVPIFRKVPAASLASRALCHGTLHGKLRRRKAIRAVK